MDVISKLLINYLLHFSLERRKYYKHITKARRDPNKYLSLIIDGMDQSKTDSTHCVRSNLTSSLWKLPTHLVGVIAHGSGIFGFFDYYQYPHGSNITINALLRVVLFELKDNLPDVLYLQMDNCWKKTKQISMKCIRD